MVHGEAAGRRPALFFKSAPMLEVPRDGAPQDVRPTAAQAASGEYHKPTRQWHGLTLAIEQPEGTVREGVDETGRAWRTVFRYAYGEIVGTEGMDGDPVDVFIGQYPDAAEVYIVQQMRRKQWDVPDEQKCMINFASIDEARDAYLGHYDDPRFFGGISAMPVAEFVAKVRRTREAPGMVKAMPAAGDHIEFASDRFTDKGPATGSLETVKTTVDGYYLLVRFADGQQTVSWDDIEPRTSKVRDGLWLVKARTPMALFVKAHVGAYLRAGKLVNLSGYQGRTARPSKAPGQIDLFTGREHGATKPLGPNPYAGKHPVHDTPDMFDHAPPVVEPRSEMVAEHKRLVAVLRSPDHGDDLKEAARQEKELQGYEDEGPDHLLRDIPGARWRRGKGLIAGHYGVEVGGEVVGNYHAQPEDAVAAAKQALQTRAGYAKQAADRAAAVAALRARLEAGDEPTDADLQLLSLRRGGADLKWFIPAAAELFGMPARAVRPAIASLVKVGHTDMGAKRESVDPKRALVAMASAQTAGVDAADHPSKPTRSLLNLVPEDRRAEWLGLHREQHELHHYEMGQLRELMDRARSARNRSEGPMREMEAAARSLRRDGMPGSQERADDAEAAAARHRAAYDKHRAELERLASVHQRLYERVADLGRQKNQIAMPSGDMDIDWAAMRKRTGEEQLAHEKSMLRQYREHYKSKARSKAG